MKTFALTTGAVAALAIVGAAFAQNASPISPGPETQPLTNQAAVDRAQQEGGTGLMGPGVNGRAGAASAGAYSADTAAQTGSGMTGRTTSGTGAMSGTASTMGTSTDRSGAMESNRAMAQNDSSSMQRAGERG